MKRRENPVVLNDRDLITLNAYLDGALSPGEVTAFEKRLASDPVLQQELDGLKATVALLHRVQRVRVPRNFTLDPAKYGVPARRSLLDRLGFIGVPQLVTAGGTLAAVLICVGLVVYGSGTWTSMTGAPGPVMDEVAESDAAEESASQTEMLDAATEDTTLFVAPAEDIPCDEAIAGPCPESQGAPPSTGSDGANAGGADGGHGGATGSGPGPIASPLPTESTPTPPFVAEATDDYAYEEAAESGPADPDQRAGETGPADEMQTNPVDSDSEDGRDNTLDKEPEQPTTFPVVPVALGGLVIVLAAGMFIARRARRHT